MYQPGNHLYGDSIKYGSGLKYAIPKGETIMIVLGINGSPTETETR